MYHFEVTVRLGRRILLLIIKVLETMSVILTFVFMLRLTVGKEQQSPFPIIGYFDMVGLTMVNQQSTLIMLNQSITLVTNN